MRSESGKEAGIDILCDSSAVDDGGGGHGPGSEGGGREGGETKLEGEEEVRSA
jgi:hypothetical protein